MVEERGDIQAVGVVDRAIVFDDADDFESLAGHQLGGHAADVAEALNDDAWWPYAACLKRFSAFER